MTFMVEDPHCAKLWVTVQDTRELVQHRDRYFALPKPSDIRTLAYPLQAFELPYSNRAIFGDFALQPERKHGCTQLLIIYLRLPVEVWLFTFHKTFLPANQVRYKYIIQINDLH
ncbi:hypothetical protein ASF73_16335 [Xanthomonas sp. Leaf131]|nr:hypothetical protein ASF73_16335 [Xanthomonas sp. Leaf131]